MSLEVNGIQNYNYFQPKPADERNARPVWGGENFFVNPPVGYTQYVRQDLFSGNTVGLSNLAMQAQANGGYIDQNLIHYGQSAVSHRTFIA